MKPVAGTTAENLDRAAVHLELGDVALREGVLIHLRPGVWQWNARMPSLAAPPGTGIAVSVVPQGSKRSAPVTITVGGDSDAR